MQVLIVVSHYQRVAFPPEVTPVEGHVGVGEAVRHGSDCIRSNTLKNGMPEADASKLPTSPIFQKDLTFPGSSI